MNTGGNYFEAGVAVPHTRWCQIANSRERERVEFGLRRQAERDAALPRANQPAATGDEASPAPSCDGASQPPFCDEASQPRADRRYGMI